MIDMTNVIERQEPKAVERRLIKTFPGMKFKTSEHSYTVLKVYSHYALCENERGYKECFVIGDLVMMGIEPIFPDETNCFEIGI